MNKKSQSAASCLAEPAGARFCMERFFRWTLTFLLLLATAMECAQVVLRYFSSMSAIWLGEIMIFPVIWMYMLGCANASREDTQISARILPVFFPARLPAALSDFLARLFSFIISIWLAWHGTEYFFYCLEANRQTGFLFLPMYMAEAAIAAGMLLVSFYCLVHFSRSLKNLFHIFGKGKTSC